MCCMIYVLGTQGVGCIGRMVVIFAGVRTIKWWWIKRLRYDIRYWLCFTWAFDVLYLWIRESDFDLGVVLLRYKKTWGIWIREMCLGVFIVPDASIFLLSPHHHLVQTLHNLTSITSKITHRIYTTIPPYKIHIHILVSLTDLPVAIYLLCETRQ